MKNYWYIKGYCYWEKEISKDEEGNVWVNIGWHLPLRSTGEETIQYLAAISGLHYSQTFN
jgi:hypothetical protein